MNEYQEALLSQPTWLRPLEFALNHVQSTVPAPPAFASVNQGVAIYSPGHPKWVWSVYYLLHESCSRGGGVGSVCVCVFVTAVLITKLFAWGGG